MEGVLFTGGRELDWQRETGLERLLEMNRESIVIAVRRLRLCLAKYSCSLSLLIRIRWYSILLSERPQGLSDVDPVMSVIQSTVVYNCNARCRQNQSKARSALLGGRGVLLECLLVRPYLDCVSS